MAKTILTAFVRAWTVKTAMYATTSAKMRLVKRAEVKRVALPRFRRKVCDVTSKPACFSGNYSMLANTQWKWGTFTRLETRTKESNRHARGKTNKENASLVLKGWDLSHGVHFYRPNTDRPSEG